MTTETRTDMAVDESIADGLDDLFDAADAAAAADALADRLASDEAWTLAYIGRRIRAQLMKRESVTGQRDAMLEHFASVIAPIDRELDYLDGVVTDLVLARRERNEAVKSLTVLGIGDWKSTKARGGWDIDERVAYQEMPDDERRHFTRTKEELDTPKLRAHLDTIIAPAKVGLGKLTVRERAERLQAIAKATVEMPGVTYRPERISVNGPLS